MTAPHAPVPPRRRLRWYQRLMDWLWFGPLTRDLYPYVPLKSARRSAERGDERRRHA